MKRNVLILNPTCPWNFGVIVSPNWRGIMTRMAKILAKNRGFFWQIFGQAYRHTTVHKVFRVAGQLLVYDEALVFAGLVVHEALVFFNFLVHKLSTRLQLSHFYQTFPFFYVLLLFSFDRIFLLSGINAKVTKIFRKPPKCFFQFSIS